MSKIEVNTIEPQCGTNVTLGANNDTISLGTGAVFSGGLDAVKWQTTPKTSTFTAESGEGYFINSGSALTMNLPAGSAGAIVAVSDYARNFSQYNLTISPNGSEKIGGVAADAKLNVDGQAATFVYVDSTKGWINVQETSNSLEGARFITATGGTITEDGDFKVHTFTGPGTFTVCTVGNEAGSNTVDYLVVASGGGGSGIGTGANNQGSGGGGAGGVRASATTFTNSGPSSPRTACVSALSVTATGFPITVGAGGTAGSTPSPGRAGGNGNSSTFSTITSAGGGAATGCCTAGADGGSGGGGGRKCGSAAAGGTGNTPPVAPPQGSDGGRGQFINPSNGSGGGGGGFMAAGGDSGNFTPSPGNTGGAGGAGGGFPTAFGSSNGAPNPSPPDSFRYFGGGGGGGQLGAGGLGGGGAAAPCSPGTAAGGSGTANTGGGGASGVANHDGTPSSANGGAGGSGIVVIRYKFQ